MSHPQYIIRVYAVIVNDNKELLLSDEYFNNIAMTKFPGGGLEFGEGTIDCLKRESIEECGQSLEIISHYYTTDFFQKALMWDNAQLVSIYYRARFSQPIKFKISEKPFDFIENINGSQSFRWKSIHLLQKEDMTFPIDQKVLEMIIADPAL